MSDPASVLVLEKLNHIERRLEDALSRLDAVIEHQKINQEIQLETVKFFELTSARQQTEAETLRHAIFTAATSANDVLNSELDVVRKMPSLLHQMAQGVVSALYPHLVRLKQSNNLLASHIPPAGRIRCAFLIHTITMWEALADVYEAMRTDDRFEPMVMSLHSRILGMGGFGGEGEVSRQLDEMNIPHIRFDMDDSFEALGLLKNIKPDVVFRQQQWDGDVPPGFATTELSFTRLCLVPYGTTIVQYFDNESRETTLSNLGFDQEYHRAAWRIFCETSQSQAYYQSFRHSDPEKFVLSGYPKTDRLLQSIGHGTWPVRQSRADRAFRVIWAPHHSVFPKSVGFGVFHLIFRQMLEWARSASDIEFVFKPHPGLLNGLLASGKVSREEYLQFREDWKALENCAFAEGQYGDLFDASDLLMTDGVSFLTEYPFFDKPLIFFDSGHHVPFNEIGARAEASAHVVTTFADMKRAVLHYREGGHWPFEQERAILKKLLRPTDEPASQVILNEIYDGLKPAETRLGACA